jgi:hypothetical protein
LRYAARALAWVWPGPLGSVSAGAIGRRNLVRRPVFASNFQAWKLDVAPGNPVK